MMMRDKKYDDATGNAYCCAKERERERDALLSLQQRVKEEQRDEKNRDYVLFSHYTFLS